MGLFGTGLQRICAVVAAPSAVEMARLVRAALPQTRTLELRLDWLTSDSERAQFLAWLSKYKPPSATLVAKLDSVAKPGAIPKLACLRLLAKCFPKCEEA